MTNSLRISNVPTRRFGLNFARAHSECVIRVIIVNGIPRGQSNICVSADRITNDSASDGLEASDHHCRRHRNYEFAREFSVFWPHTHA